MGLVNFGYATPYQSASIQCTTACRRSLRAILKAHPGLMSCPCEDSDCMVVKRRVEDCIKVSFHLEL